MKRGNTTSSAVSHKTNSTVRMDCNSYPFACFNSFFNIIFPFLLRLFVVFGNENQCTYAFFAHMQRGNADEHGGRRLTTEDGLYTLTHARQATADNVTRSFEQRCTACRQVALVARRSAPQACVCRCLPCSDTTRKRGTFRCR